MARVARVAATAKVARAVASRAVAATAPVTMTFRQVSKGSGHEFEFDVDVRAGDATHLDIVNPFLEDYELYSDYFLTPGTTRLDNVRISTDRPVFLFWNGARLLNRVQVDLRPEPPRVMGTPSGPATVR